MKQCYVIFKSPSMFDLNTLEYVKTRICTEQDIIVEIEELNANAENCYYWVQQVKDYKYTED